MRGITASVSSAVVETAVTNTGRRGRSRAVADVVARPQFKDALAPRIGVPDVAQLLAARAVLPDHLLDFRLAARSAGVPQAVSSGMSREEQGIAMHISSWGRNHQSQGFKLPLIPAGRNGQLDVFMHLFRQARVETYANFLHRRMP